MAFLTAKEANDFTLECQMQRQENNYHLFQLWLEENEAEINRQIRKSATDNNFAIIYDIPHSLTYFIKPFFKNLGYAVETCATIKDPLDKTIDRIKISWNVG